MSDMQINQVLAQMRVLASKIQHMQPAPTMAPEQVQAATPKSDFSTVFKGALDKVNGMQKETEELRTSYEKGDPNVDLVDVMLSSQKSSLAFQATLQVRNKLVSAYQDIMNMQV